MKRKTEILSPAGDMECLKMAVVAGADAIYIGGRMFGARKFAPNFNDQELEEAVKFCHLYGVRLYVTVNTIIYENEIDECINYVDNLHKIGVDAIIVQDIGLIRTLRSIFPNLEIHASTQCHNYNEEQFKIMEELGVKRVVLARETDIDMIKNIKTTLEKEVFIHGAICISYSGQCLFSSLIMNRSGNRGECSGMCRLPYKLVTEDGKVVETNGDYLLSPKELSTIPKFKELMDSDIISFKIEGRMKSKEYVYLVTKIYRTLVDKYNQGLPLEIDEEEYKNLKIIYNREFTLGHLFNETGNNLMNIKSPNHLGIKLGEVIKITDKKIYIKLVTDLYQEDGIRFVSNNKGMILNFIYDLNDNLINSAKIGDTIVIDNKINLKEKTTILKTSSNYLNKEIEKVINKKIPVNFNIKARNNSNLEIEIYDNDNNKVRLEDCLIENAKNNPTDKETIYSKLSKLGNTPFYLNNINYDLDDNIFIPLKNLNEIRRVLVDKLVYIRENKKVEYIKNECNLKDNIDYSNNIKLSVLVNNEEQLNAVFNNINGDIYITDRKLYLKYKDYPNIYYQIPRLDKNKENINNENILCTDLSNIHKYSNNNIVSDYYLNVVNSKYINYLFNKGIDKVTLSVETNINQIKSILDSYKEKPNVEVIIYGKLELMIMKHCLLNNIINKDKMPCNCCKNKYYLKDRNNKKYEIKVRNKITRIYSYKDEIFNEEDILKLKKIGIKNYRINLLNEDLEESKRIIKNYKNTLEIN